jgi:hypothetical protein
LENPLRLQNGEIYTVSPSYSDRKCIPPTVDLSKDKLFKEFILGVNSTFICELDLPQADYAANCNYEYYSQLGILDFLTSPRSFR